MSTTITSRSLKPLLILAVILNAQMFTTAQLCPGGGTSFSNIVTFDPAWIYGCNTGTSCNGGVHFDNQTACEPTTSLDACAPAPSCGTLSNSASDIWFRFYASSDNVVISGFQNTSFVIGLQAFSGSTTCGSLSTIGCAVASGPSSGVSLPLTGLAVGELYYFRIFGSAGPISQRSGIYCFCGTSGVQNYVLPDILQSFKATNKNEYNQISWKLSADNDVASVEVQKSNDGQSFYTLETVTVLQASDNYSITDKYSTGGTTSSYRLRIFHKNGSVTYSSALTIKYKLDKSLVIISNKPSSPVELVVKDRTEVKLYRTDGRFVKSYSLKPGHNTLQTNHLNNGVYFLSAGQNNSNKIVVLNN